MKKYIITLITIIACASMVKANEVAETSFGVSAIYYDDVYEENTVQTFFEINSLKEFKENLGLQLAGGIGVEDADNEIGYVSAGLFLTKIELTDNNNLLTGINVDYAYTVENNSLIALRPTVAISHKNVDAIGAWVQYGVYRSNEEEVLDQSVVFWNHMWGYRILSEINFGYQFGDVESPRVGGLLAYQYNSNIELRLFGETSLDEDVQIVGIGVSIGLGGDPQPMIMSGEPSIAYSKSTSIHNIHNTSVPIPVQKIVPQLRSERAIQSALAVPSTTKKNTTKIIQSVPDNPDGPEEPEVCEDLKRGRGHQISRGRGHERNHCDE